MTAAAAVEPTELEELMEAQAEAAHARGWGRDSPHGRGSCRLADAHRCRGPRPVLWRPPCAQGREYQDPRQAITSFIGPSGCGKSTLLRCFNRMNDGIKDCRIEGKDRARWSRYPGRLRHLPFAPARGHGGFQRPNPFPMSIYDNVAYGPRGMGVRDRAVLDELVEDSCVALLCGTRSRTSSKSRAWVFRVDSSSACASPAHLPCSPTFC